jgi:hypothetical protein
MHSWKWRKAKLGSRTKVAKESATATVAIYNEELVTADTLATNNGEYAVTTALNATKNNYNNSETSVEQVYREETVIEECNDTKNDVEVSAAKTTSTTNKFKKPL